MLPLTPLRSPPEPPVPIRLYVPVSWPEAGPPISGAPNGEALAATMVSVSVAEPAAMCSPPSWGAELPETVQPVIVSVPP